MQLLGRGWFHCLVIGLCVVGLGLSGGCKPDSSGKKPGAVSKPTEKKEAGTTKGEGAKKAGGKKSGGKKKGGGKGEKRTKGQGKKKSESQKQGRTSGETAEGKPTKPNPNGAGGEAKESKSAAPQPLKPLEGIVFTVPANWRPSDEHKQDDSLRACYALPGKEGSQVKLTLLVHNKPAVAGKAKENLTQWCSKIKPAAEAKEKGPTFIEETSADGIRITIADMSGMMDSPKVKSEDGKPIAMRMIAAVIEDRKGPHTVRISGPQAAMDAAADSIMAFIRSVKLQS